MLSGFIAGSPAVGGLEWMEGSTGVQESLAGIAHDGTHFIAVGGGGFSTDLHPVILRSAGGEMWQEIPFSAWGMLRAVAHGQGRWVAVGGGNETSWHFPLLAGSGDGWNWEQYSVGVDTQLRGIAHAAGRFVAVGGGEIGGWDPAVILVSASGEEWTPASVPASGVLHAVTAGDSRLVAVGGAGETTLLPLILTSEDGEIWEMASVDGEGVLLAVAQGNGWFVAVGDDQGTPMAVRSADGLEWGRVPVNLSGVGWRGVRFVNGAFYAVGTGGAIFTSPDGETWTGAGSVPVSHGLNDLAGGDGRLVAVGDEGTAVVAAAVAAGNYRLQVVARDGTVRIDPSKPAYAAGEVVRLEAVPDTGHLFHQWSGSAGGQENPLLIVMDADKQIEAHFRPSQAPRITAPPVGRAVAAGSDVEFQVTAAGANRRYQWYQDDRLLEGRTLWYLYLSNVQAADAGWYRVVVSNAEGQVSAQAELVVTPATPTLTRQPEGRHRYVGGEVTFTVAARGTEPFTYQWRFNGADLPGQVGPVLRLTGLQPTDSGEYSVAVSNSAGVTVSVPARLEVITGDVLWEREFPAHTLRFTPDGSALAASSSVVGWDDHGRPQHRPLTVWRRADGAVQEEHTAFWGAFDFSPDGTSLAAQTGQGMAQVGLWSWPETTFLRDWAAQYDLITAIGFSPDGRHLGVRGGDSSAQFANSEIWLSDVAAGKVVAQLWPTRWRQIWDSLGNVFAFCPNTSSIASLGDGIEVRRIADHSILYTLAPGDHPLETPYALAFTPDGSLLIAGYPGGTIRFYGTESRTVMLAFQPEAAGAITALAVSPDGRHLAFARDFSTVALLANPFPNPSLGPLLSEVTVTTAAAEDRALPADTFLLAYQHPAGAAMDRIAVQTLPTQGDLLLRNHVTFGEPRFLAPTGPFVRNRVLAADLNRDGHPDLVSASNDEFSNTGELRWLENRPGHSPQFVNHLIRTISIVDLQIADLDQDGDLDLVAAAGTGEILWFENDGQPLPTFTQHLLGTAGSKLQAIHCADLDGDGHLDVLAAASDWNGSAVLFYRNDGARPPRLTRHTVSTDAAWVAAIAVADLDGDGCPDLVTAGKHGSGQVLWFRTDPDRPGEFERLVIDSIEEWNEGVNLQVVDLDADGLPDLLLTTQGGLTVYYNSLQAPGTFHRQPIQSTGWHGGSGSPKLAVADIDRDGNLDLVLCAGQGMTQVRWLEHDGRPRPGFRTHTIADINPVTALLVADLNEDGLPDLVIGDGQELTWRPGIASERSIPALGTLTLAELDRLIYRPRAGQTGPDTFTWTAFDGHRWATESSQVRIAVDGAPPPAPPRIHRIDRDPVSGWVITFSSVAAGPNTLFELTAAPSLEGPWVPVMAAPPVPAGELLKFIVPREADAPTRFYRILETSP